MKYIRMLLSDVATFIGCIWKGSTHTMTAPAAIYQPAPQSEYRVMCYCGSDYTTSKLDGNCPTCNRKYQILWDQPIVYK